ncbi:ATP-binding protein [Lysobacter sp. cf310]|uniref:ATP-binding protein n=1 Tax=Lysobacter sp. cf310 TaxID=1761790 RepID=UPI0008E36844|nr:ATP-binding protein [Lysobacter sp. cf310]SFL20376.1 Histidine kinase-, DNA gyrase B-, and HSP90-like ATPase [Lysobacter sp. cf310]
MADSEQVQFPIKARSHVLRLLGDELIGDDGLAVFELVKNSYDADATTVRVEMQIVDSQNSSISVADNGTGMSIDDIEQKWLVLATDSKRGKENRKRSNLFKRSPLGEKGIGRIAAFKLGEQLRLTTKADGHRECVVDINFSELLDQGAFLDNLRVSVRELEKPDTFSQGATGTIIEISKLYRQEWTRADLRKIQRLITSLASPFETPDSFEVSLSVPGREKDLAGMFGSSDFTEHSIWEYEFSLTEDGFSWSYRFKPPLWKGVKPSSANEDSGTLLLISSEKDEVSHSSGPLIFHPNMLRGIGPIHGLILGYYRRTEVLGASGNQAQLKRWLDDQTGVRVYRDGIRVFNYGEPGDDWLNLNVRRINTPGGKFGTNSIVAAVSLSLDDSDGLKEKTNREGFDSGGSFIQFRQLITSVFDHFEREAKADRTALDAAIKGRGESTVAPPRFMDAIWNLKQGIKSKRIDKGFLRDIEAIEHDYQELRDVMVSAGTAGLNLAVIFHEVERGIEALANAVDRGMDESALKRHIEQLNYMLHGFAPLLKRNTVRPILCSEVVSSAERLRRTRFQFHKVVFSAPVLTSEEPDFKILAAPNLLIGALGNLLDNSLYWSQVRREREDSKRPIAIRVATVYREADGSSLIAVVDNGTGFSPRAISAARTAFFSERPEGMGLGLYFAGLVAEQCGGMLTIGSTDELRDEVDIPAAYDGAAVSIRFPGK